LKRSFVCVKVTWGSKITINNPFNNHLVDQLLYLPYECLNIGRKGVMNNSVAFITMCTGDSDTTLQVAIFNITRVTVKMKKKLVPILYHRNSSENAAEPSKLLVTWLSRMLVRSQLPCQTQAMD
jgi:hypothetical protein